jgi:hypothetical protein
MRSDYPGPERRGPAPGSYCSASPSRDEDSEPQAERSDQGGRAAVEMAIERAWT